MQVQSLLFATTKHQTRESTNVRLFSLIRGLGFEFWICNWVKYMEEEFCRS